MKSSEQMTMDVLKRRDEALKAKRSPARRIAAIAVPCAAVLAVTAVAAGVGAKSLHGQYIHHATAGPDNINSPELGRPDIAPANEPDDFVPRNPNAGKYNYYFVFANYLIDGVRFIEGYPNYEALSKPEYTFIPYTPQGLNSYYGIEFDRLSRLHSDWSENIEHPLGIYYRDFSDDTMSAREISCTTNTLNYTTPSGASITVTAKNSGFVSTPNGFREACEIGSGPYIIYDEAGNKLPEFEYGFWPDTGAYDEKTDRYKIEIYTDVDDHSRHLTYINMGVWVKLYAEGLSDEEFFDLVNEYTK